MHMMKHCTRTTLGNAVYAVYR